MKFAFLFLHNDQWCLNWSFALRRLVRFIIYEFVSCASCVSGCVRSGFSEYQRAGLIVCLFAVRLRSAAVRYGVSPRTANE